MIYNEILILTLCNADKDTIDQINKRALLEEKETRQSLAAQFEHNDEEEIETKKNPINEIGEEDELL